MNATTTGSIHEPPGLPRRSKNQALTSIREEREAPELDQMQQTIQYNVEINCGPCPDGYESRIVRQLQTAFPVTGCRNTRNGLAMRLVSTRPFADGALKDFADMVCETLTNLGIRITAGVVRLVTRQRPDPAGVFHRIQDLAAMLTGLDLRPVREVPVLYFYKGLRFDLDLSARLQAFQGRGEANA